MCHLYQTARLKRRPSWPSALMLVVPPQYCYRGRADAARRVADGHRRTRLRGSTLGVFRGIRRASAFSSPRPGAGSAINILVWARGIADQGGRCRLRRSRRSPGEKCRSSGPMIYAVLVRLTRDTRGIVTACRSRGHETDRRLAASMLARAELIEPGDARFAALRTRPARLRGGRCLRAGAGHRRRPSTPCGSRHRAVHAASGWAEWETFERILPAPATSRSSKALCARAAMLRLGRSPRSRRAGARRRRG